ncbi:hypothetical protein TI39_contig374g00004 [Zymoseptoria brevis]|uniref:PBP domain-containing protein n=1 Tax=Zymoseptoria brevis TaxID=1047168 RepID=A0A0F4GSC6_9PEZI|nr:hypothetical protein TI39_contig374g00004 [Zymoseptoria brevis]
MATAGGIAQDGRIAMSHPWISRHYDSRLLVQDYGSPLEHITTTDQAVYGDPSNPISFRIGNGGAGYTGLLQRLCEAFINETSGDFRIGWVANHSRHSQIALLADVVQVALTYEPANEDVSIAEGWARRVCRVFNDRFILVGPKAIDTSFSSISAALRSIARSHDEESLTSADHGQPIRFHSRGDGSATFAKEQKLWKAAGVDESRSDWIETWPLVPYQALVKAEEDRAFLLTDRSTFLTAKKERVIPNLKCWVEGGSALLNPCSVMVATFESEEVVRLSGKKNAECFAAWLGGGTAQEIVRKYGKEWELGRPLFTTGDKEEFDVEDRLDA